MHKYRIFKYVTPENLVFCRMFILNTKLYFGSGSTKIEFKNSVSSFGLDEFRSLNSVSDLGPTEFKCLISVHCSGWETLFLLYHKYDMVFRLELSTCLLTVGSFPNYPLVQGILAYL